MPAIGDIAASVGGAKLGQMMAGDQKTPVGGVLVESLKPKIIQQILGQKLNSISGAEELLKNYGSQAESVLNDLVNKGLSGLQKDTNAGLNTMAGQNMYATQQLTTGLNNAIQALTQNFSTARQQFTPYQESGLQALDKMTQLMGLSGAPSVQYKIGQLGERPKTPDAPKTPTPMTPANMKWPEQFGQLKDAPAMQTWEQYLNSKLPTPVSAPKSLTEYANSVNPDALNQYLKEHLIYNQKGGNTLYQSGDTKFIVDSHNWADKDALLNSLQRNNPAMYDKLVSTVTTQLATNQLNSDTQAYQNWLNTRNTQEPILQQQYAADVEQYNSDKALYDQYLAQAKEQMNQYNTDYAQYQNDLATLAQRQQEYDTKLAALQAQANAPALTSEQINAELAATPGYQFQYDQGIKALQNRASAKGLTYSGSLLKELQEFGQGLASTTYSQRLSELSNLVGQGFAASQGSADLSSTEGTQKAALQTQYGQNVATLASQYGQNVANLLQNQGISGLSALLNQGSQASQLRSQLGTNLADLMMARGQANAEALSSPVKNRQWTMQGQQFI